MKDDKIYLLIVRLMVMAIGFSYFGGWIAGPLGLLIGLILGISFGAILAIKEFKNNGNK